MRYFLRKHWSTLLILVVFGLLIFPHTGLPIKVFVQRLVMISPSEVPSDERKTVSDYNWALTSLDGNKVSFSNSEEKVILVNFWATWCAPCVAELPAMQRLYDEYGLQVDFYFVTAEDTEMVSRFMQKKGFSVPVFIESTHPPKELRVSTIPTTFVISKEGKIVIQKTGAARWDSEKVKEILAGLIKE